MLFFLTGIIFPAWMNKAGMARIRAKDEVLNIKTVHGFGKNKIAE
jgi:hypothetical protein